MSNTALGDGESYHRHVRGKRETANPDCRRALHVHFNHNAVPWGS